MRRNQIVAVVQESIGRHFERDVADAFDLDDLDNVGRMLQEREADERKIDSLVRIVSVEAKGSELDALADGDMDNPNAWLYARLRDA
jgi:hypothetical protein